MKRKNLTMKKLSAVLISATMMLNGGVPIQAASAELTDPYANETLSDGSGDEAENLDIGTDEETVNESTDEEENIEIEAEDEFDSADDGEEEALDIDSETEDAMMESGDSGESAFYSEQRVEYHNKFEDEEDRWLTVNSGNSFSLEAEKTVYGENDEIEDSTDVKYEIISVESSDPDIVSVDNYGDYCSYKGQDAGDADLTVKYKVPDDETEHTWICHVHVSYDRYTVNWAMENAFPQAQYGRIDYNEILAGTTAVITAGIDAYSEKSHKTINIVDKNALYEESEYTFEWSVDDTENVTLTSDRNQCEVQVKQEAETGSFNLSLKVKDKNGKYLPFSNDSNDNQTVYSEKFVYSVQSSSYELLYTTDYEENYGLYPEVENKKAFYTTPGKDINITITGIKETVHTASGTQDIIHEQFVDADMTSNYLGPSVSRNDKTFTFSSSYFEGMTTFDCQLTLEDENNTKEIWFPNIFAFYGMEPMRVSNLAEGGKLNVRVDCKVHKGDSYEKDFAEGDDSQENDDALPVHRGDTVTLTLDTAGKELPAYAVLNQYGYAGEFCETGVFRKNDNGTYTAVIDTDQLESEWYNYTVMVYSNENECRYDNMEYLTSLDQYDLMLTADSSASGTTAESNKTDSQAVSRYGLKAIVKNGETIEVTFTYPYECKPSEFSLYGTYNNDKERQDYKIENGTLSLVNYKNYKTPFLTLKQHDGHQATLSLTAGEDMYKAFGANVTLHDEFGFKSNFNKRIKYVDEKKSAVSLNEFKNYDFNNIVLSDTNEPVLKDPDCDLILCWDTYDADGDSRKEWNLANLTEKDYNEIFACADEAQDSFQIMIKAKSTSDYYGYSGYLNFVIKSKKNIENFVQSESYQKLNEGVVYLDGNPSDLNITLTDFDGNVLTQENALDIFWATNNLHEMWGEETKEMPTKSGRYRLRISPKEGSGYQGELYKYGIYLAYHISDIKATEKNGLVDVSFESKNSENVLTDVYFIIGKDGKDLAVGSVKNISTRELKDFNLAEVCARNELAVDEDYDVRVTVTQYLDSSRSQSVGDYIGIKFHYQGDKPHEHTYKTTVVKATASKDGSITRTCTGCDVKETTVIPYVKTIALSKTSYAYNGKVQKPSVTVKDAKNGSLKLNTDYTVTYSGGQKNAGTYKVVVKGKGNYDFTKTLTYKITKATATVKISTSSKTVKYRNVKKKKQTFNLRASASSKGKLTYKKTSGNNKITVSKTGKVTVKKGLKKGTYKVKIKVSAAAVTNYNAASATKTIKVVVK